MSTCEIIDTHKDDLPLVVLRTLEIKMDKHRRLSPQYEIQNQKFICPINKSRTVWSGVGLEEPLAKLYEYMDYVL